jgi:pyridoxal phosphate enzyme (YggS family)
VPRLVTGLEATRVRANLDRVREAIADAGRDPDEVDILAAVKYVPVEEIGVLGEAGLTLLGENRAQDLETKATQHPEFRWHFIGALQSRKVKQIVPYVELIHSVASESALRRLEQHADAQTEVLLEVNVAGEAGKEGIAPDDLPRYLELAPVQVTGLMTMPPFAEDPEDSRRHFARLAELAAEHNLPRLSMGTSQDYAVAASEGATIVRIGTTLYA